MRRMRLLLADDPTFLRAGLRKPPDAVQASPRWSTGQALHTVVSCHRTLSLPTRRAHSAPAATREQRRLQ
jgi:hypothetical protein